MKFKSLSAKIGKWALGKADKDYEDFFLPAMKRLQNYLEDKIEAPNDLMKIIYVHNDLNILAWWNYHKFLDLRLNNSWKEENWRFFFDAMQYRILKHSLGYSKPQNIGPVNEGQLACCICDAIFLSDPLVSNLIKGYSENHGRKPPQVNPKSIIQYAFYLYNFLNNYTINLDPIFKSSLEPEFENLYNCMFLDVNHFEQAIFNASEFHLNRSKGNAIYEFNIEEDMMIPSELLATLKIRNSLGLEMPLDYHPLLQPFAEVVLDYSKFNSSEFIDKIKNKIQSDYFNT